MATKLSEAQDLNSIQFQEQSAVGATPASTFAKLIALDDGTLHYVNDGGTDTDLTASGTASEIALTNATELTIATGAITKTQTYHSIDTQSDAGSDDLDTISGGTAGEVIYIFAVNDARDVVLKNGTGNILTFDGNDITLDEDHKIVSLIYDGTNWRTVGVISAGGSGAPTTAEYVTLALDGTLSAERVLTAGSGIALADGGANGNATLSNSQGAGAIDTLSTGVVTIGDNRNIIVAAESGTADDLIEVSGLSVGETVWLRADTGDTITTKHNDAGATIKIHLYGNADVILDEQNPLILKYVDTNVLSQVLDETGAGGGMTSFTLAGDSGGGETISDSDTLSVLGGTGLTTVDSATDTVTVNLDNTAVTPAAYTYASLTVDQQGRLTAASNGTTPAPVGATYIVQTANGTLSAEQAMGALGTGIVKNTTTTGVQSIAVAGTDYTDASSTDTFTNKGFDANGTGNSLSNVDVADLANGTDGELITWSSSAAPATVAVGTATHVLTSNGAGAAPTFQAAAGGGVSVAIMQHTETSGTSAGGSSATTWNALQLDDEKDDPDNIVVIGTDKFVPISGNYHLVATSTNFQVSFARLRLYNVTGTAVVRQGTNARVATGQSQTVVVQAYFTANGTDEYRFDQWSAAAQATNGLGDAMTTGEEEVYVSVILTKI